MKKDKHMLLTSEEKDLDLCNLESISNFAKKFIHQHSTLDVLILNKEIVQTSRRELTVDGFEKIFATNYLGHFALTAYLFPLLKNTPGAQIIAHCDLAHLDATIDFDDLQGEKDYDSDKAYGQSMLALLLFSQELERRIKASGLYMKCSADDKINGNWARPTLEKTAKKLWSISEELTGTNFVFDEAGDRAFHSDFILPAQSP